LLSLITFFSYVLFPVVCAFWYWLIGYTLAFGTGSSFLGMGKFRGAGQGLVENQAYAHWFFQFTFAATAATIVSGAVGERCSFIGYLVYSSALTG
jgi:Amt family ammonium transporter